MVFEETELRLGLRLGLPGNGAAPTTEAAAELGVRKRGFSETETDETATVDLMLNLSPKEAAAADGADPREKPKTSPKEKTLLLPDPAKPPAK